MKTQIHLLKHVTIGLAVLSMLLVSAPWTMAADDDIEYYRIRGKLQALILIEKEKKAVISGRTWELVPNFTKNGNISGNFGLWDDGTPVRVYYYVVVEKVSVQGSTPKAPPEDSSLIREHITRDELLRIHQLGGKIWAIEFPMGE